MENNIGHFSKKSIKKNWGQHLLCHLRKWPEGFIYIFHTITFLKKNLSSLVNFAAKICMLQACMQTNFWKNWRFQTEVSCRNQNLAKICLKHGWFFQNFHKKSLYWAWVSSIFYMENTWYRKYTTGCTKKKHFKGVYLAPPTLVTLKQLEAIALKFSCWSIAYCSARLVKTPYSANIINFECANN